MGRRFKGVFESIEVRFWRYVQKTSSCWNWTGAINSWGYGQITELRPKKKSHRAHRLSMIIHGLEIPPGLVVDHICKNRKCVNPDHLRLVTLATNSTENSNSPTAINKTKTHCKNGHEFNAANTRISPEGFRRCRTCIKGWNAVSNRKRYQKGKNEQNKRTAD